MKFMKRPKSLAYEFSLFAIGLILLQSVLLVGALILGGVLTQSRENVYQSFLSKVAGRAKFLQSEIDNRWTNIDPYVREIRNKLSGEDIYASPDATREFLYQASDTLISMLRITGATGSFLILNDDSGDGSHSSLYFRNYDPATNSEDNKDLYILAGPAELAKQMRIPMDRTWQYKLRLDAANEAFYKEPYEAAALTQDYAKLLYWSDPFRITQMDEEIITCSVPVFDHSGQVRGVMGVEVLTEYFKKLLPANELTPQDSLGYLVAQVAEDRTSLSPVISKGGYQKRVLGDGGSISLKPLNREYEIFRLEEVNAEEPIYGCIQEISFYRSNVPYESKGMAVVGLMEKGKLMAFVELLQQIFLFSFLGSLLFGATAGVAISRRIVSPVVKLADKVRDYDYTEAVRLEKTGLSELDELSNAIEASNRNLLDSTLKMSKIMDLLHVAIGAFEYKSGEEKVTVTSQLFELLGLSRLDADSLYVSREVFVARLAEIQSRPERDEQQVYHAAPDKWIKIERLDMENSYLGVVSDVTEEIRQKHRIKQERDYDFLTQIYNRAAFQREVELRLAQPLVGTSGLVMFDLDNLKGVNDTHGHEYGDIYIRSAAQRLERMQCGHTIVGRRSGDEFFVFFHNSPSRRAVRETIRDFYRCLEEESLCFPNGEPYQIGISAGVSWYGVDAFDYEELLRHADFAMYEVKQSGKGRLGEFYPECALGEE